jgi:hypothetical protein
MFDPENLLAQNRAASVFITLGGSPDVGSDVWDAAGHAIEQAYRGPLPIGLAARTAIVLALLLVAKLCSTGVLP